MVLDKIEHKLIYLLELYHDIRILEYTLSSIRHYNTPVLQSGSPV